MGRFGFGKGLFRRQTARPKVVLRGLTRRDQSQHAAHLLRLSREDRRARFHVSA